MVGCPFYRELLPLGRRMLGGGVGKRLCQSLSPWLCLLLPKVLMSWGLVMIGWRTTRQGGPASLQSRLVSWWRASDSGRDGCSG